MSVAGKLVRFAAGEVAKSLLAAAGTKVGEALGNRIGAKIYTPPPEPSKDGGGKSSGDGQ